MVRVIVDGRVAKTIPIGIKLKDTKWNADERIVQKQPNTKIFNQKIRNRVNELHHEIMRVELLGVNLTKDWKEEEEDE